MGEQPLTVLLISPVESLDPASGDVTYTKELLATPPPAVRYVTYDVAMERGWLRERGARSYIAETTGPRRVSGLVGAAARKANVRTRALGFAYRETVRHFEVEPGRFDLVHLHVFHARFHGAGPAVVGSSAGPLQWVYGDAWHWSRGRICTAEGVDRVAGLLADATMCSVRLGRARRLIAFSDYQRNWMMGERGLPGSRIDVVPNYVKDPQSSSATAADRGNRPTSFGMIAKDFEAKGGTSVLRAFTRLKERHPQITLHLVGSEPRMSAQDARVLGITWTKWLPREDLLTRLLPTIDVMLHPSRFDGFPYGPMEALAFGVPVITSNYRALPELAANGAGLVVPVDDDVELEQRMEQLLEPARVTGSACALPA